MLNEGEKLFNSEKVDVRPENKDTWKNSKEWLLQGRENGFVPYWWDDGESISIEMLGKKSEEPFFPCHNRLAGKPNPEFRLDGYSLGSSNHMAQDLGVMLVQAWLVLHNSDQAEDRALLPQITEAAKHLEECRTRHGSPNIPAVVAAYALCTGDEAARNRLPSWDHDKPDPKNAFLHAKVNFKPGEKVSTPGFADDQEYIYYAGVVRHHSLPRPLAYTLALDAFTNPLLYAEYCDDVPPPPGINRLDLYPFNFIDGKPEHLRSQRKGPNKTPIPIGSRMGPQNMAVCGWALQAMHEGGEYETIAKQVAAETEKVLGHPLKMDVKAWLERELGGGLRTWQAIFEQYGYIPTGIGAQKSPSGDLWEELSDTGGYAHLINAASQWILYKEGKADWKEWEKAKR
jgi:hypothetical protein